MFGDSLLEATWAQRSRRSWTTLTSLTLQALAVAVLLLISLLRSVDLPRAQIVSTPISLGRLEPMRIVSVTHAHAAGGIQINPSTHQIMLPRRIPTTVYRGTDDAPAPPAVDYGGSREGSGDGSPMGIPIPFSGGRALPVAPTTPAPPTRTFRTSKILEGMLIRRVDPTYPALARGARIQGSVVLAAIISKTGTIDHLRVLRGHPMLVQSAINAVSQWRYRPYILNNEPIEVETEITVNFSLSNN